MKKVLGLVISNRNFGNSELLVKEIMTNIPGPIQPELIRLTDLLLKPCKACYKCLQPAKICPVDDDFNYIMDKIQSADALIIGVPVYFLGLHGYYKLLTDRLLGLADYVQHTRGKPCVLVMPYGTAGWSGYSQTAGLVMPRLLQMHLVDCWQVHATLPGEALLDEDNLEYARQLGQDLFSERRYQPAVRACARCGAEAVRLLPASQVECCICGAQGRLSADNVPEWADDDYCRFDQAELEEHFQVWLPETKELFMREKSRLKTVQKNYRDKNWWIKP